MEETDSHSTVIEPIDSSRTIVKLSVSQDCSLVVLIEKIHKRKYRPGCAFFEFTHESEDIRKGKEVILMSKVRLHNFTA